MVRIRRYLAKLASHPRIVAGSAALLGIALWWMSPVLSYRLAVLAQQSSPEFAQQRTLDAIVWAGGHYPAAQILRSRLLLAQGRTNEAIGAWLTIPPDAQCPPEAVSQLGHDALARHEFRFALEVAHRAVRQCPEMAWTEELLARSLAASGDLRTAAQSSERLTKLAPGSPSAWRLHMDHLRRLLRIVEAVNAGETALQLSPAPIDEAELHRTLSELYLSRSDASQAGIHAQWVLDHATDLRAIDYIRRAYAFRLTLELPAAIATVEQGLKLEPDSFQGLMLRGFLSADSGRDQEAVADLQRVLSQSPNHKESHYKLARCLLRLGRTDEADKHLKKSRELHEHAVKLPVSE